MSNKEQLPKDHKDSEFKSPITVKEEEIDLVKFFNLISQGFSSIFNFLIKMLKMFFHGLIVLLIFLKQNILKIISVGVIGLLIGGAIDFYNPKTYTYDMIIQPNYGSVDQVFKKMEYYNVLIEMEDSTSLANIFDLTHPEANSLVGFELLPYETDKDKILAYDEFVKSTDSLTQMHFTFEDFIGEGTSKLDSKEYIYRVNSTLPKLKSLSEKILFEIENNKTIQKRKKIRLSTLKLDSISSRVSLLQIDSLRSLYKKVTLLEVENNQLPSASTYLNFGNEQVSKNNDIELFNISKGLNDKLIEIEMLKETSEEIVNVVTNFNEAGRESNLPIETYKFKFLIFFSGTYFIWILLVRLNFYLNEYRKSFID